jgi:hypothetical protein
MTLPSLPSKATPTTVPPRAQARRVKRGIVAGYIHDISARHGDEPAATPSPARTPAPAPQLTPAR